MHFYDVTKYAAHRTAAAHTTAAADPTARGHRLVVLRRQQRERARQSADKWCRLKQRRHEFPPRQGGQSQQRHTGARQPQHL